MRKAILWIVAALTLLSRIHAAEQAVGVAEILGGYVSSIRVTVAGSGYGTAPIVTLEGGGGTGAVAKAFVDGDKVVAILILNAGSGYQWPPNVLISAPPPTVKVSIRLVPEVTLEGPPGGLASLLWSTSPDGPWTPWTNLVLSGGGASVVDITPTVSTRYYRSVVREWIYPPDGMVALAGGPFQMGASNPQTVTLSPFAMDRHEVTRAQWDQIRDWGLQRGYDLGQLVHEVQPAEPVGIVTWFMAVRWCNARSEREGLPPAYYEDDRFQRVYRVGDKAPFVKWDAGYRLPTEAEWEYAARGGAVGLPYPWSDTIEISKERANYLPTHGGLVMPVGSFAPNGFGLFDMAGNASEWCWDWFGTLPSGPLSDPRGPDRRGDGGRIIRGGHCQSEAGMVRVDFRGNQEPWGADDWTGFRCVIGRRTP